MRAVTYLLTPTTGDYGHVGRFFREKEIWLVAVHSIDPISDDTVVMQFEVAEPAEALRERFPTDEDWIHDYQIATGSDNTTLQLHFEPAGIHRDVLALHHAYPVALEYPVEVVDAAAQTFRVTEVGRESDLRKLIQETRETIDVNIEQVSEYRPVSSPVTDRLTETQRLVLETAVHLGYYRVPRDVTYAEIAAELECSTSAVGQHLRRAEQKVMAALVSPGSGPPRPDSTVP